MDFESEALHMVSFEIFVKAMPPSLSELKVLPRFCFAFKIPDDVAASNIQCTLDLLTFLISTNSLSLRAEIGKFFIFWDIFLKIRQSTLEFF